MTAATAPTKEPQDTLYDRLTFHLTYGYAPDRDFHPGFISGPDIPNAYNPTGIPSGGEWEMGDLAPDDDATDEQILASFFAAAVSEATHEALEWFKLDGTTVLDPHGEHEALIHGLAQQLGHDLLEFALPGLRADGRMPRPSEEA